MKKAILFLAAISLLSCSKDDDDCKCKGKFTKDGASYFYAYNVDCTTGAPASETNPDAFFLGCEN